MNTLIQHGVTFSLDDYGTGYSNLRTTINNFTGGVNGFKKDPELSTTVSSKVVDQYVSLAPLKPATDLGGYGVQRPNSLLFSSFITKDCENVELAMKFLDFFYEDETVTRTRHGEKGIDWVEGNGETSFMTTSTIEIKNPNALHNGNSTWDTTVMVF